MEEIVELKQLIINREWEKSLVLIEELEAMVKQDKINHLQSCLVILIVQLIKIQIEERVTKNWRDSIVESLLEIQKYNQFGKKSYYLQQNDWLDSFQEAFPRALIKTSQETFSGIDLKDLTASIDRDILENATFKLLKETYNLKTLQLFELIKNSFPITDL